MSCWKTISILVYLCFCPVVRVCVCVCVCVYAVTASITTPRLSGVVTYTVLALSPFLSLCITIHLSVSSPPPPPPPHLHPLPTAATSTYCVAPTFLISPFPSFLTFSQPSKSVIQHSRGCSLSRSPLSLFFFYTLPF